MTKKEIIFLPCAGLANRLRSIASAMTYAQEHGYQLRILWDHQANIFMAPFELCFRPIDEVVVEDHRGTMTAAWNEAILLKADTDVAATLAKTNLVKSYYAFYDEGSPLWLENLRSLIPRREIQERIYNIFEALHKPIIGVHIRRTDHTKSIQNSPTEVFITAMRTYTPDTHFYVASDSEEERARLQREFPGRIILGPQNLYGRNSQKGSIDAVLELFCLSKCDEILGSFGSSFSEVAAQLGDKPLKICTI